MTDSTQLVVNSYDEIGKRMQFQHEGKADEIHNINIVTMGTVYTISERGSSR